MKRINTSQMNVASDIAPLDETFLIESVDGRLLEQWYYVTEDVWYPDRKGLMTPLLLRPSLQLTNPDTRQRYVIDMSDSAKNKVRWFHKDGEGEEEEILNTVESLSADYTVKANGDLVVRKNVDYNTPVTLRCLVKYTEPRTGGYEEAGDIVVLRTNQDAKTMYSVQITPMNGTQFSPLNGDSPTKVFQAKAYLGDKDVTGPESGNQIYMFYWFTVIDGEEVAIDNLLGFDGYSDEQGESCRRYMTLNADYIEKAQIILMMMAKSTDADLKPCRDTLTLSWRIPKLECNVYSDNGDSVKQSTSGSMTFRQSIRTAEGEISQAVFDKYLAVEWTRQGSDGTEVIVGTGPETSITADDLRNDPTAPSVVSEDLQVVFVDGGETKMVTHTVDGTEYSVIQTVEYDKSSLQSSLVTANVYLKDQYAIVTHNGDKVVYDGMDVVAMG